MHSHRLTIGWLVNPLAGTGGSLGLKGSDGQQIRDIVHRDGLGSRATDRAARALATLLERPDILAHIDFCCWGEAMGESLLQSLGIAAAVVGHPEAALSSAADTRLAAATLRDHCDLLVFTGGDGTARDVFDAVGDDYPVLGVPAGVKMHSSVFAVSPEAAGELLLQLAVGGLVGLSKREVRDIDEDAFREGRVRTRFYGEMSVPGEGRFLQHTKVGGREDQALVAADIAAWMAENLDPETLYLIGPGSTTDALMQTLGLQGTLLGVDAVLDNELVAADANEHSLLDLVARHQGQVAMIVTVIGGQGHVFGRGNQQFSPALIRAVGRDNIMLVAAKSKISALEGRALLVDTNDPQLDRQLSGLWPIVTGYDDAILYPVGAP